MDSLLAGCKKRVCVDVHDGTGPGGEGNELVVHGYSPERRIGNI
jgi:hypothetical protein